MDPVLYSLRKNILPWRADEILAELVEFCLHNSVDEVMVFIDSEEFNHGLPTVEWLDEYLSVLRHVKRELERINVLFSLNPWATLVHCDRGRDLRSIHPDIDLMVGHDGTESKACACPLSEGWRRLTRELWHRYASLEPHVLWVEDDIRLLNHQPVAYGCFCPLHLQQFSKRVGRAVGREELVAALLAPGKPHPFRKAWLDLNREIMNDVARFFERCVHEVSPGTHLGLMCSGPTSHAIEGRDWAALTSALAGDQVLYARPCMLNYVEVSPRGLYDAEYNFRATQHCLGPGKIVLTEAENIPFFGYSKSATFTFMQCALSVVFGADGVTLSISDHMGTSLDAFSEVGQMLREAKPFLCGFAERCRGGKASGIQLLHAQDGSYHVRLDDNADYPGLSAGGDSWRRVLEPLGFPVTFEDSDVVALSGQVIRALPRERVARILAGGVVLDLTAFESLVDMGYSELLGAEVKRKFRKYDAPLAAEEYFNEAFGGSRRTYLTLTLPDLGGDAEMAEMIPAPSARVVSRMVDPDANPVYPFLILFENRLGGRVATYPLDINYCAGPAFLNPHRQRQFEHVIQWLSKGCVPLMVSGGAYSLPFRLDSPQHTVVGACNLSLDDWSGLRFRLFTGGRTPSRIETVHQDGRWRSEPAAVWEIGSDGTLDVCLAKPLRSMSLSALSLCW